MIDLGQWFPGPSDDDPVKRTLDYLGQTASNVGSGLSQAASDVGAGIASWLPGSQDQQQPATPEPRPAESWAPEDVSASTLAAAAPPESVPAASETAPAPWSVSDVTEPVQRALSSMGDTAGQALGAAGQTIGDITGALGANAAANRQAVEEANAGRTGGVDFGTGLAAATAGAPSAALETASQTWEDPFWRAVPGPARGAAVLSQAGQAFGGQVGANVADQLGVGQHELANIGGLSVTGQDVGRLIGGAVFDPTSYVGAGEADPLLTVARGIARDVVGPVLGRGSSAVAEALARNAERVALSDAAAAAERGTVLPGTLGALPEEYGRPYPDIRRDVHGTVREVLGQPSEEFLADTRYPRDVVHPDLRAAGIGPEITPQVDLGSRLNAALGVVSEQARPVLAAADTAAPAWGDTLGALGQAVNREALNAAGGAFAGNVVGGDLWPGQDDQRTPEERLRDALLHAVIGAGLAIGVRHGAGLARLAAEGEGTRALAALGQVPEERPILPSGLGNVPPSELRRPTLPGIEPPAEPLPAELRGAVSAEPNVPLSLEQALASQGAREPTLPGLEGPREPYSQVGPLGQSDRPNAPATVESALGNVPPSQVSQPGLPGMAGPAPTPIGQVAAQFLPPEIQNVVQAGQAEAERTGLSPLAWTRKFLGQLGYSSLIGPTAATAKTLGDLAMALGSHPKEIARAISRGAPEEYPQYVAGGMDALMHDIGPAVMDALAGRGQYGSHGGASLSSQTINPFGRALATGLEAGGRAFMGLPTAIFGEFARGAGERLAAAQAATDAVRSGQLASADWYPLVNALAEDARAVRGGALPRLAQTQGVIQAGVDFGKRQTFQNEIGPVGEVVRRVAGLQVFPRTVEGTNSAGDQITRRVFDQPIPGVTNFLRPIFGVPWNMHARMLEASPLGLAREGYNVARGRGTNFDRMYDAVTGSAAMAGMAGLAGQGLMTGSGPTDPEQRRAMVSEGWQPYSSLVNGVYVPNRALFGLHTPFANLAGDVHDAIAYRKPGTPILSPEVGMDTFWRLGSQLRQEAFLQPLADALSAVNPGSTQTLGARAAQYAASTIDRFVPYASTGRVLGTSQDPLERAAESGRNAPFLEQVRERGLAGLGVRSAEPEAQDILGRPMPNPQQGLAALTGRLTTPRPDPVIDALRAANALPPPPHTQMAIEVPGAGQGGRPGSVTIQLTPDETREWNRLRGESILQTLTPDVVSRPDWRAASPVDQKVQILAHVLEPADRAANLQLQAQIGAAEINRRVLEAMAQGHP